MSRVEDILEEGDDVEDEEEEMSETYKDFIEQFKDEKVSSHKRHKAKDFESKLYVSDLFSCRYKKKNQTLEMRKQVMEANPVVRGILTEEGMKSYMLKKGYRWQQGWTRKINGTTISGRIEFYHPDKQIAMELKSPLFPYEEGDKKAQKAIAQCQMYIWLSKNDKENPLDKVDLVQLCVTERKEWEIFEPMDEETIIKLINNPQSPFHSYECKYCELKGDCPYS